MPAKAAPCARWASLIGTIAVLFFGASPAWAAPGYIGSFGSPGTEEGQFEHPSDVAVDASGDIWVLERWNFRVQRFSKAGEYQDAFGTAGSEAGELWAPAAVALDAEGNLWIADTGNDRIQQFDDEGNFLQAVGEFGSENSEFIGPRGIAVDSEGDIWVSDTDNGRLQEFDDEGEFIQIVSSFGFGEGELAEPAGIDIGPGGDIWVADRAGNRVSIFDQEGELVREFGSEGSGPGQFMEPGGIDVDIEGNVWVGDADNSRVQLFDEGGEYVEAFGEEGSGEGQFLLGHPFGLDSTASEIIVADSGNNRIQRWAKNPTVCHDGGGTTEVDEPLVLEAGELECEGEEPLEYEIVSEPEFGEISEFNPETGELVYTPEPEFEGPDSFTFRASNELGSSPAATFTIGVGAGFAVTCFEGSAVTEVDEPLALEEGYLECEGEEPLEYEIVSEPEFGEISEFNPETGELVYTPESEFYGYDTFAFRGLNPFGSSAAMIFEVAVGACERPKLDVEGEARDPKQPGVDLNVEVEFGESPCDESRVDALRVFIDEELVFSEERSCPLEPEDPCDEEWEREIQLPYAEVIGTHDYRVEAEDQFSEARPKEWTETTSAEGTVSQVPPEAEDSKESEGCKTPKNRHSRYVFRGKVVYGTPCADKLYRYPKHGTTVYRANDGDDVILAGGEINSIRGGGGDDRIYAGRGNDKVYGEGGEDQISGGSGDDELRGQGSSDSLIGNSGSDILKGDAGNDLLRGGTTADSLFGGSGDNTLSFSDAVNPGFEFGGELFAGFPSSRDHRGVYLNFGEEQKEDKFGKYIRAFNGSTARFAGGVDKIYVSDGGFKNVIGSPFADSVEGSGDVNLIDGGGGTDILKGAGGNDVVYGGADSDLVDGGADQGAGNLRGGDGDDICLSGTESSSCERESTEEGGLEPASAAISVGRLNPGNESYDTGIFVRGSEGKDTITATWDEKGKDVDLLAKGESGFDWALNGVSGCTLEKEKEEEATAARAHCLFEKVQTLVIDGGDGNDVLRVAKFPAAVSVTLLGGEGRDVIRGGNTSEDILVDGPGEGNDDLYGAGDDDTLLANDGLDRLYGNAGSDLFVSASICEGDKILGGSEKDNASWAQLRGEPKGESGEFEPPVNGVSVSIPLGEPADISRNGGACAKKGQIEDVEFLEGSGGNDLLEGNNDHNILLGRSGKDELIGLGGEDNLLANNRDPGGSTEQKEKDPDETLDCGLPSHGDVLKADPADPADVEESCERVNYKASPAQASIAGIGDDPTAEAVSTPSDEAVIGGQNDPEAVVPEAFFLLDEASGTAAANWIDEEAPGSYEEGVELDLPGAIEESRGIHLDGEDDYIDLTNNWDPEEFVIDDCGENVSGYTIEMWVKFDAEASGREELFSRSKEGEGLFLYRSGDGRLNFSVADESESPTVSTDGPVKEDEWHHVVATMAQRDESCPTFAKGVSPEEGLGSSPRLTLFVNGFSNALGLDGRSIVPEAMPSALNLVGAKDGKGGLSNWLEGTVDDVAIFGTPLDDGEVQTHLTIGDTSLPPNVLLPPIDPEDGDGDEDGIRDSVDNCASSPNADQEDGDGDGVGDVCQVDADSDEDEVPDEEDNCPEDANPWQEDTDENGVGDACEPE